MKKFKDHPLLDKILAAFGKPVSFYEAELFNYDFGDGKKDRWRVNFLCKKNIETNAGNIVDVLHRPYSWFLHYNEKADVVTYCNPPIHGLVTELKEEVVEKQEIINVSQSKRKASSAKTRRVSDSVSDN